MNRYTLGLLMLMVQGDVLAVSGCPLPRSYSVNLAIESREDPRLGNEGIRAHRMTNSMWAAQCKCPQSKSNAEFDIPAKFALVGFCGDTSEMTGQYVFSGKGYLKGSIRVSVSESLGDRLEFVPNHQFSTVLPHYKADYDAPLVIMAERSLWAKWFHTLKRKGKPVSASVEVVGYSYGKTDEDGASGSFIVIRTLHFE